MATTNPTALITYGTDANGNGGYLERVSIHLAARAVQAGIAAPATAEARADLAAYSETAGV